MSRSRPAVGKAPGRGQIIRHKHRGRFTIVPNAIVEDDRLSVAAKGLLCYLISRPPNWQIRNDQVGRVLRMGRKMFDRCRNELIDAGYLVCDPRQGRDGNNRFTTLNYVVSDVARSAMEPQPPRPKPLREKDSGNKKEEIKTDLNNSLLNPLSLEGQEQQSKIDRVKYSELGRRALDAGNHPVFVGSKPYNAWLNFRGADGMPQFVDCIETSGRLQRVVWMPSVYPPKSRSRDPEED